MLFLVHYFTLFRLKAYIFVNNSEIFYYGCGAIALAPLSLSSILIIIPNISKSRGVDINSLPLTGRNIFTKESTEKFIPIPLSVKSYDNLDNLEMINVIRNSYNQKGIVYGIINNLNNKTYIGSTTDFKNRIYNHLIRPKRSNKHLQSAIKLIGLANFTLYIFTVIELSSSLSQKEKKELILPLEQKYIDMFPKSQLYNFLSLSSSPLGFKHSNETRLLMSINSKGKNSGKAPFN